LNLYFFVDILINIYCFEKIALNVVGDIVWTLV
jgi:hypothetical protein